MYIEYVIEFKYLANAQKIIIKSSILSNKHICLSLCREKLHAREFKLAQTKS